MVYFFNSELLVSPINKNKFIIYFPDQEIILLTNKEAKDLLLKAKNNALSNITDKENIFFQKLKELKLLTHRPKKYIYHYKYHSGEIAFRPSSVILAITKSCNLRCIYCYANGGNKNDTLSRKIGYSAIDFITENAIKQNKEEISVHFHGGGEPTLKLNLLKSLTNKTIKNAEDNGLKYFFSIGTNGVLNEDSRKYIKDYINSITLSLDGFEEVQNFQRPSIDRNSYREVIKSLEYFDRNNLNYGIRMTVTKYNCDQMPKFVEFIYSNFHPQNIQLEPVTLVGRAQFTDIKPDSKCFLKKFLEILKLSIERGYKISYSGLSTRTRKNFCSVTKPNFIITEDGYVSSCLEILELNDPRATTFIYGKYDSLKNKFIFDQNKIRNLQFLNIEHFKKCNNCIAKYSCAGDCPAKRSLYGNPLDNNAKRCYINKELMKQQLLFKLEQGVDVEKWLSDINYWDI